MSTRVNNVSLSRLAFAAAMVMSAETASAQDACPQPFPDTWTAPQVTSCMREILSDLSEAKGQIQTLEARPQPSQSATLPDGAVIAVHNVSGCPSGWDIFGQGVGRFMVGAGNIPIDLEDGFRTDDAGRNLRTFKGNEHGGEILVELSSSEVPAHHHVTTPPVIKGEVDTHPFGHSDLTKAWRTNGTTDARSIHPLSSTTGGLVDGSTQAHNNMPPYIAVYFCKQQER